MTTVRRVERLLRQAIERRLEEGYGLRDWGYGLDDGEHWIVNENAKACPVGLFLIGHRCIWAGSPSLDAAVLLGITRESVGEIIGAFDGDTDFDEDSPYVDLGRRLRRDYFEVEG